MGWEIQVLFFCFAVPVIIPEHPPPAKVQEQTSDTYIILTVVFSCLVTACVIGIVIIQRRKSISHLALCKSYLQGVLQGAE
jgi:hypothetical protein